MSSEAASAAPTLSAQSPELLGPLKRVFGHNGYRDGQAEIINSILGHGRTLAVMPTGSGKSLCYQLPALALGGTTIVVSPLLALIRDQVEKLERIGVAAASLTSANSADDRRDVMQALRRGQVELLYVAPERFRSVSFVEELQRIRVGLFVIDEAHCISQWGHDFRPDYARLGAMVAAIGPERVVGLTATATPDVRADVLLSLGLDDAETIVTGFDRPNLELSVIETSRGKAKLDAVAQALDTWMDGGGSGIVYVATRKHSEEVADLLRERGFEAEAYHAGLPNELRQAVQDRFQRGADRVVVATSAFGMGVDKADVRVVVHYSVPSSTEAYYQEVGRAGRDGAAAGGVLIYDAGDLRFAYMRLESSCPTMTAVQGMLRVARRNGEANFEQLVELGEREVGSAARAALIALERSGDLSFSLGGLEVHQNAATVPAEALDRRERMERGRLDAMIGYVLRAACRRRYLVDYFGDARRPERCGVCDRCLAPPARTLAGAELRDALVALSCVARMRGRFGKNRVVEVLTGQRNKAVSEAGLDQLSTFGLLKHGDRESVLALLDALIRGDLARVTIGEYPKLMLTDLGAETLKQRAPVQLDGWLTVETTAKKPKTKTKSARAKKRSTTARPAAPVADADLPILTRLRAWRTERARHLALPAYVVAHNALLEAIAAQKPRSLKELARVPGLGPARLERYGEELLALLREG